MKKNNRGSVSIYITFIIVAVIIIVIAGVLAPMGVLFNVELFKAGEGILNRSNASISGISDANVKAEWGQMVDSAVAAADTNVEVNTALFKYAWLLVVVLTGLVLFLFTRRLVEFQRDIV